MNKGKILNLQILEIIKIVVNPIIAGNPIIADNLRIAGKINNIKDSTTQIIIHKIIESNINIDINKVIMENFQRYLIKYLMIIKFQILMIEVMENLC